MRQITPFKGFLFFLVIISLSAVIPIPASAIWTTDGEPAVTFVRPEVYYASSSPMTTDGAGGSIICWVDERNGGRDLYAQRIDATGQQKWATNGLLVGDDPSGYSKEQIVSDGAGGAVIVYYAYGSSGHYAQRIDASGNLLWGASGVAVFSGIENPINLKVIPDGFGGMLIAWQDSRNANDDIYAQRFSPGGVPRWTVGGVAVCTEASNQERHEIVSDGAGGMIVGWDDNRNGNNDLFAQRVDSSGAVLWSVDGNVVCDYDYNQDYLEMISDGMGGAIFAWEDLRAALDWDIYAARITSLGITPWAADGVLVCSATDYRYDVRLTTDGGGGAILAWRDARGTGDDEIYAQRINLLGIAEWTANGIEVCTPGTDFPIPQIVADGAGGAIIAWEDDRSGNRDIYSQRVNATGALLWTAGGIEVCGAIGDQQDLRTVSDDSGGIILSWYDERVTFGSGEIFAQRLDPDGDDLWRDHGAPVAIKDFDLTASDIVTDGAGGSIICWSDRRRDENDLYAQRMDSLGNALWTTEGLPVSRVLGSQSSSRMVSDGAGGAIIVWTDSRNGNNDIYAQRIDASGNSLWTSDGFVVSNNPEDESAPRIVSDNVGGAIVVWGDRRGGNYDVYAQRISYVGVLLWGPGGKLVCSATGDQWESLIVPDGSGGAVIGWLDNRAGYMDIYAQRVDYAGTMQWAADGVSVCTVLYQKENLEMAPDGSGGAFLTWRDARNGNDNVFVQKINSGGNALWPANGRQVIDLSVVDQYLPQVASDCAGGAIVVWEDHRGGSGSVYAQHVGSDGIRVWHPDGRVISYDSNPQFEIQMISDGAGGVVIAWTDYRTAVDHDIYTSRIGPSGDLEWVVPANGIPVCTATEDQMGPRLVSDGFQGAILVWSDKRPSGEFAELYAQKIKGAIGSVEPTSLDFGAVPILSSQNRSFTVSNIGDLTLSEEFNITGQYYRIFNDLTDYSLDPGEDLLVQVSFEPDYEGVHTCDIATGNTTLSDVFCTGTGLGPVCEIDTVDIDLPGFVMVGDSYDTTFTVTNAGGGILSGYISMSDGQYNLPAGEVPFSLYRYDTLEVTVRFKPTVEGTHQCVVETGTYLCGDVTVTGTAYLCPPDTILYVDVDAAGAETGVSWTDAFMGLQDALARADLCGNVTEIWVAEGTYYASGTNDVYESFMLRNDLAIYGGFAGTESLLSERDLSANTTVLSGNIGIEGDIDDNSAHVVIGSYTDSTAVLDGFVIEWGHALPPGQQRGGGMFCNEGSPTLRNLVFRNNRARLVGGGIYFRNGSDAKLYNCVFFENDASDFGGGIYNDVSSPLIVNCTFSRNRVDDSGAALFNENYSSPTLINVIMWGDETNSMFLTEIANHGYSDPVISYSLIQYCGDSGPGWATSYGIDGGKNTEADPDLVDMASGDLHLVTGSPAIDEGDQTVPGLPSTDLDGNPRIQGSEIDMGAYEGGYEVVRVDIDGDPTHFDVTVDGEPFATPYTFYSRSGAVHEIGTSSPQLQGDIIYSFANWSDAGDTIHDITLPVIDRIRYTATFTWASAYASIDSIVDVPGDQGGWARVYFKRSHYDDLSEIDNPIERYDMHRRVDSPVLAAAVLAEGKRTEDGYIEYDGRLFVVRAELMALVAGASGIEGATLASDPGNIADAPAAAPPGLWEVVGTVSASQQEQYLGLAPTLADSAATIPYSVYYVSAHSTTPAVYFDSPADSGYSVDNIAPGVPLGFAVDYNTGSGNELSWDSAPESDFQYYRVYRDTEEGFIPGPGNLVHQTVTPIWSDPEYDGWDVHYKITTLDHVGNESDAASPGSTTDDDIPGVPKAFALHQNVPNPFNPVTMIRFDLPQAAHVKLCVYNVKGELVATLVDHQMTEGRKEISWTASDASGKVVASGMYFYRLVAGDFVQTRKMVLLR
ncbi:MAG: choice-of-anchor D domain-containing protein [Bacteroidales bacterium]|nr:choice-of-anchor D domain-containing protein [Candidatus Latescibacterota bacterium]